MTQMCKDEGLTYLDHSSININGFEVFGSAYTPFFFDWAYNVQRGEPIKKLWAQIPDNTNILVTHGPPMNILDPVERFVPGKGEMGIEHVGCVDLYNRIQELKELKLSIFGHIHLGHGQVQINNVTYINASICTEDYKPTNKPIIIDL